MDAYPMRRPLNLRLQISTKDTNVGTLLPAGIGMMDVKCSPASDWRMSFATASTNYLPLKAGQSYWVNGVLTNASTLYAKCPSTPCTIDIMAWQLSTGI